jgi:hypothetical protein
MSEPESQDAASAAPGADGPPGPSPQTAAGWTPWQLGAVGAAACVGGIVTFWLLAAHPSARNEAADHLGRASAPAAAPAPGDSTHGATGWSDASASRWTGGRRRSLAFELPAERAVAVWMRHVRPVLVVRCLENRTDAFVFTDSPASIEPDPDARTVRVRLDDKAQATERWVTSADHDGLFAPDGSEFARRIASADRLEFGFTPQNAVPVVATFDLHGADAVVERVAATCGRRPR